jgi:hypothetical protein
MVRKSQRKCDLHQKAKTHAVQEEKQGNQSRHGGIEEVLEEFKKTFGVYVRPERGFDFPSLGFLIQYAN